MGSVTSRIKEVKQPRGGYLKPSNMQITQLNDGLVLHDSENIHASIIGLVVDYLTRALMVCDASMLDRYDEACFKHLEVNADDHSDAARLLRYLLSSELSIALKSIFQISWWGVSNADDFGVPNALLAFAQMHQIVLVAFFEYANNNAIGSEDWYDGTAAGKAHFDKVYANVDKLDDVIVNVCKMVTFDVWYRAPENAILAKTYADTNPDRNTIENIKILLKRSLMFFYQYGPVIEEGFTFEGGYTSTVSTGDGDFLTADTLWDFKVLKAKPNKDHTLQILMYYIMGQHSKQDVYKNIRKIGLFNPRLNTVYIMDVANIPDDIIKEIETNVIGYSINDTIVRNCKVESIDVKPEPVVIQKPVAEIKKPVIKSEPKIEVQVESVPEMEIKPEPKLTMSFSEYLGKRIANAVKTNTTGKKCPNCGTMNLNLVEKTFEIKRYQCANCGKKYKKTINVNE